MKRQLSRALLAGVLGLGVMAGLLRADGPAGAPVLPPPTAVYFADGSPAGYLAVPPGACAPAAKEAKEAKEPKSHPIYDGLCDWCKERKKACHEWWAGVGCQHHNNEFGCGCVRSDLHFIFGSCREFFGDPCHKGPPAAYTGVPKVPYQPKIPQPYLRDGAAGPNGPNGGKGANGPGAGGECDCP
jgi:hypothetical protein